MNRIQDMNLLERLRARMSSREGTSPGRRAGGAVLLVLGALTGAFLAADGEASGNSVGTMPSLASPSSLSTPMADGRPLFIEGPRQLIELALIEANGLGSIEVVAAHGNRRRVEFRGEDLSLVLDPEICAMPGVVLGLTSSDFAPSLTVSVIDGIASPVQLLDMSQDSALPISTWMAGGYLDEDVLIHTIVLDSPIQRVRHGISLVNGLLQVGQTDL